MPDYRAYIVGKEGHFESFEVVQAIPTNKP
jgi:hypothetical protein